MIIIHYIFCVKDYKIILNKLNHYTSPLRERYFLGHSKNVLCGFRTQISPTLLHNCMLAAASILASLSSENAQEQTNFNHRRETLSQ